MALFLYLSMPKFRIIINDEEDRDLIYVDCIVPAVNKEAAEGYASKLVAWARQEGIIPQIVNPVLALTREESENDGDIDDANVVAKKIVDHSTKEKMSGKKKPDSGYKE